MRFFLEFVSCCGSPTQPQHSKDEERWLVPVPPPIASRPPLRKKRGRMGGHDWRPSLRSISEDFVVPPRETGDPCNGAAAVSAGRDVKRRGSGGGSPTSAAAKVRHPSYSDGNYGPAAMPTILPAFSPTPFMF